MYEQIHNFLQKRNWAQVSNDGEVSGITWIELFVLFDIAWERTELGQYLKKPDSVHESSQTETQISMHQEQENNLNSTTVVTKATLDEEIKGVQGYRSAHLQA